MKAPRRTPWANPAELEELYEMLFSPSADSESRRNGIARMSIYISSPSCPTFVHLLHSLVSLELLPYPPSNVEDAQRLRLGLGMGIVRFVNSLVDPLQTGPYARPISHLAATLSLPPALIALRHRATHEDLPPLSLLHSALGQCISYLHHYSFLPLLSSSSSSSLNGGILPPGIAERLEAAKKRVESLVKRWKRVQKVRLREKEVREEDETALEVKRIKKALEVEDGNVIVDVLVGQGGLVPIADKKRASFKSSSPPTPSLKIWLPLLQHLSSSSHSDLSALLSSRILDVLLNPGSHWQLQLQLQSQSQLQGPSDYFYNGQIVSVANNDQVQVDKKKDGESESESFRWGLATWLIYLWTRGYSDLYSISQSPGWAQAQNVLAEAVSPLALSVENKMGSLRRLLAALLDLHEDVVIRRLYSSITNQQDSFLAASSSSTSSRTTQPGSNTNIKSLIDLFPAKDEDEDQDEVEEPELHGLEVDMDDPDAGAGAGAPKAEAGDAEYERLNVMENRLAQFEQLLAARKAQQQQQPKRTTTDQPRPQLQPRLGTINSGSKYGLDHEHDHGMDEDEDEDMSEISVSVPGWRRLTAQEWTACPIGCVE
ncbi:hypothetical protein IAT40_005693 [Kwoniella sp. CBS 6097]